MFTIVLMTTGRGFVARTIGSAEPRYSHKDLHKVSLPDPQCPVTDGGGSPAQGQYSYTMVGGTSSYSRKEIRDVISFSISLLILATISAMSAVNEPKRSVGPERNKIGIWRLLAESSLLDASPISCCQSRVRRLRQSKSLPTDT